MTRLYIFQLLYLGWILLLLQIPVLSCAQEYLVSTRAFSTTDGLSNDQVLSLLQDSEGFIWIGTKYGLNRFDGHHFRVFTKESHGLQSSIINQLMTGPEGRIWIIRSEQARGNYDFYNIDLLDPVQETVVTWEEAFPNRPFSLEQLERVFDLPGGILFKVAEQGYYLLNGEGSFQKLNLPVNFQFISAPDEGLLFGQLGTRYLTLDLSGEVTRAFQLEDSLKITRMVPDHAGNYWCLTGTRTTTSGIVQLSSLLKVDSLGKYTEEDQLDQPSNGVFLTAFRNGHSLLYIYAGGIREYELSTDQVWVNQEVFRKRSIILPGVVLVDQNDGLWIGDYLGLRVFDQALSRFSTYLKDQEERVSARGMTVKGNELIYTYPGEPHALDLRTLHTRSIKIGKSLMRFPSPFSVLLTADDQLVFGGKQMVEVDGQYRLQRVSDLTSLGEKRIWSFSRDRKGNYWLGFGNKEVVVIDPDLEAFRLVAHNGFTDIGNTIKWHFYEDGDYFWIAAQNGLYLVHQTKGVVAQFGANADEDHYLPALIFHFIHQDAKGNYWLATGDGGLIRFSYDPQNLASLTYQQYKKKDGIPSLELYAILEDDYGMLWISTSDGLVQFDPQTEEVLVYYEEQGISDNEFNRLSYYHHPDGRMFFGGLNGITAFEPKEFQQQSSYAVPLRVSSASLRTFGSDSLKNIRADLIESGTLTLQPEDDFLNLEFSLQDYFYSDRVRYHYRIPRLRDQWLPLVDHSLQLAGLPYGTHTLEVRARGRMNKLSSSVLQLKLIVIRPFYLQWWFIALVLLTASISVWQYNKWRKRALLGRQLALERTVVERTKKIQKDKQVIEEQALQLRELDELKSQFFENVSHELRTPLTLILGPLEKVLKRDKLENRDFTLLLLIKDNAKRLHKRINELLDLSRIDALRMTLHPESVDLYAFVKNILAQFEGSARLQSVNLLFEFNLNQELWVMLDPDKVEKILYNLLTNAIKFTRTGGNITLRCTSDKGQLVLEVSDTGIGIPEADLPLIFDRFHRGTADKYYEGTGIGLALCKELAELMAGKVTVSSKEGKGSIFSLEIPLQESFQAPRPRDTDEVAVDISALSTEGSGISGDPILVVEDNPSLREYLRLILEDFHVETAAHGQAALDILANGFQPALIVTDIMMPVMDGMALLKEIRENEAYCSLPVIMLTAKVGSTDKIQALRIGVDDYLTKPFVEEELIARVQAVIRNNRQRMGRNAQSVAGNTTATNTTLPVSRADLQWLETVEGIIMSHMGDTTFGINQLAEQLQMSPRRVQQKLKVISGMTPKKYQREIQLEFARRRLESGDFRSVAEVSRLTGFADAHYFSKLYEKRYGKRPSDY